MKKQRIRLFVLGMVVVGTALSSLSYTNWNGNTASATSVDRYINVSGSGSIKVSPDVATIQLGVQTTGKTSAEAQTKNTDAMKKVTQTVQKLGIKTSDIKTQYVSVYPTYDYQKSSSDITGYSANNQLSITVSDVTKAGEIVNAAMEAGANNLNGVTYDVKDRSQYYDQAVEKAMAAAKSKATAIAKVSNQTLGAVLNVTDNTYDMGPYTVETEVMDESAGSSKANSNNIGDTLKPNMVEISANLNITFGIK